MTTQQLKKKTEGFTIIEVLIVLAIAGLIMLIVFLAIPALQRSQRNNARNTEGSRISAQITECVANFNGKSAPCDGLPASGTEFFDNAGIDLANDFKEITSVVGSGTPSTTTAVVRFSRLCDPNTNDFTTSGADARDFAVVYRLEPNTLRCIDSE